jgi:hypothetical protein
MRIGRGATLRDKGRQTWSFDCGPCPAPCKYGGAGRGSLRCRFSCGSFQQRFPVLPPAAALVEIAVLFCLIIGLGWLTGQDISDMRPHPFWVPVLLLSLQYGTVSGLLAAGIATLFTAFGQLPEQTVGETYFVYFLRIWIEPILWIASAVLLGQFRMRQIADKMELVRQVEELGAQRASLADYAGQLRRRCEGLERRLAGRQEPDALVMLQSIAQARQLGAPGISAAFAGVMQAVLPGAQASLFVLDQDRLRQALTVPATGSASAGAGIAANGLDPLHPLYHSIVTQGQGASVLTAAGEAALAGQGLLAVPVRAANGVVIGMLKVETMDSHLLGSGSVAVLDAVAGVLAGPLQNVLAAQGIIPAYVSNAVINGVDVGGSNPGGGHAAGTRSSVWRHVAKRLPAGMMGR